MSAARTPGPWALDSDGRGEIVSLDPMFPVPICDMRIAFWRNLRASAAHGMRPGEIDAAIQIKLSDAAFIVLACNAHDALTARVAELTAQRDRLAEALDGIVDYITKPDTDDDAYTVTTVLHIAEDARAALAKDGE